MNSLLRALSVFTVMAIVGVVGYHIRVSILKKRGVEDAAARKQAVQSAKKYSVIGAFVYMVAMVSVAGLFI